MWIVLCNTEMVKTKRCWFSSCFCYSFSWETSAQMYHLLGIFHIFMLDFSLSFYIFWLDFHKKSQIISSSSLIESVALELKILVLSAPPPPPPFFFKTQKHESLKEHFEIPSCSAVLFFWCFVMIWMHIVTVSDMFYYDMNVHCYCCCINTSRSGRIQNNDLNLHTKCV